MEFYSNGSLSDKLQKHENGLSEAEVKSYFRSLISAIHYCHEVQNIAHRDIKPENIMLQASGLEIKLCDFGCSEFFKMDCDQLTRKTKGTYLFMAPEIIKSNPDDEKIMSGRSCDIWAAGITLYNLLTNKYPFSAKNLIELADKIRNE